MIDDMEKEKRLQKTRELYEALTELEEEREKSRKLTVQVNKDFENYSIPFSMKIGRKKIYDLQQPEKTNRWPGGQMGHQGHVRKRLQPTQSHEIPASEKYAASPDFRVTREFSRKTEAERKEIYVGLMGHPVMNTDFTNANVNGKSAQVLICASPFNGSVLFLAREHKGHAGIAGSPIADYQGILAHDHDVAFFL